MSVLRRGNFQQTLFRPTQHNKVAKQNIKYMTEDTPTRVDKSKTVEDRIVYILQSFHSSTIPLVFAGQVSPRNSDGFLSAGR